MRNFIYLFLLILPMIIGCSGGTSIVPPESNQTSDIPVLISDLETTNHNLLGMWTFTFNEKDNSLIVEPDRMSSRHYNATVLIPRPEIQVVDFNPFSRLLNINVTLTNPFDFDAFDVRLIIYTNNAGTQLINADNWTGLFDIPGGKTINPFVAFAKDIPNRNLEAHHNHKENLLIMLPQQTTTVRFAVDASVPDNCEEPYQITNFTHDTLNDDSGSSCNSSVTVRDWQNDVSKVYLSCPAVTGIPLVEFVRVDAETWNLVIINLTGAVSQNYPGYIIAYSADSNPVYLYEPVIINVTVIESHWVRTIIQVDTSGGSARGKAIILDGKDNVYITGGYMNEVDFDPGPYENIKNCEASWQAFLVKYDRNLNYQWAITWGVPEMWTHTSGTDLVNDNDYLYVTGYFQDTVDFDPGPGNDQHTAVSNHDTFISKFDLNGNFLWVVHWGGISSLSYKPVVAVDLNHDIYLSCCFRGTVDFDPSDEVNEISSTTHEDIFLSKLSRDGDYLWTKTWSGTSDSESSYSCNIGTDNLNNIYLTGAFRGILQFKLGETDTITKTSNGYYDVFVFKVDSNGEYINCETFGGIDDDSGKGIAFGNAENLYIGGYFNDSVDFNPDPGLTDEYTSAGESDSFISKFDTDLNYHWTRTLGDAGEDYINCVYNYSDSESVYFAGESACDTGQMIYLGKLTSSGDLIWEREIKGNPFYYDSTEAQASEIIISESENSYSTGFFQGRNFDFDPGPGEDRRSSYTDAVCFTLKMLPNGYWE